MKMSEVRVSDQHLTKEGVEAGSKMAPVDATLLLVRGSALHNEIRAALVKVPVAFNQDVKALVPHKDVLPKYLTHVILGNESALLKLVTSAGNTAGVLETRVVQSFEVFFPSFEEQVAITAQLDTVDALVASLEKLIAKKQAIKLGMMQELLTGKTRLPGFSDEWSHISIGESGVVSGAGVDKTSNTNEIPVRLLNYVDVYHQDFINLDTPRHAVTASPAKLRQCDIQAGDVFFTPTSETPDDIAQSAVALQEIPGAVYSYHLVRWRPNESWNPLYLGSAFKTAHFRSQVVTLASGSGTRYVITMPGFRSLTLPQPPLEEQAAIGRTLKEASDELAILKAELTKVRAIKQGMMQELLTGRTRLASVGV
jgi:type I restriction enzyme S subunit